VVSLDAARSTRSVTAAKTVTLSPFGPLVRAFVIALAAVVGTATFADPDLWGHVRFGGDIAESGAIRTEDPYSFTSDRPWINHEWLSEWSMYQAYRLGGGTGLVLLKALLVGLMLVFVLVPLREWRPAARRAYDLGALVAIVGAVFRLQTMRPQLFGLVCWAALLAALATTTRRPHRALFFAPLVFEIWANTHGSWPLGLAALGLWSVLGAVESGVSPARRATILAIPVLSALATLINPFGIELWTFLADTVRPTRPDILEWAPIVKLPWGAQVPWLLSLGTAIVLVARAGRPSLRVAAVLLFLCASSFVVSRLDAFFALAVVALLSPQLARVSPFGASMQGRARDLAAHPVRVRVVALLALAGFVVPAAFQVRASAACLPLRAFWLPEPESIEFAVRERLSGRMVTWFDWGELAIWHFGPALQVSMDGRRETVYSAGQIDAHLRFYEDRPDARDLPDRLHADYIWIPKTLPVVPGLRQKGWQPIFDGPTSLILARRLAAVRPTRGDRLGESARCFPGP
jgi:hypothetical protein